MVALTVYNCNNAIFKMKSIKELFSYFHCHVLMF